ncbi:MAG TPA: glycosyltransferase [Bauldia sp.]|nr:glycosyltransferase [Bauldia sp.]
MAAAATVVVLAAGALAALLAIRGIHTAAAAVSIGTIGTISLWRYGWWLVQVARAAIYLNVAFPRLRATADAIGRRVPHLYAVVCSYEIPRLESERVYRALIENCLAYGTPATIVAAITSSHDEEMIRDIYESMGAPEAVEIIVQFQKGDGKRSALAHALRSIARREPPSNALVALIDGDVVLDPAAIAGCAPMFVTDSRLSALTTNNDAIVSGNPIVRHWFALRHAQRHVLMSSMALSGRLLVLTGRFSMFRARDAITPEFIDLIERESFDHWRLGRLRFVSGDDKSTWYYILKHRGRMLYVPDVKAVSFESMPRGRTFVGGATALMLRWYGNMLRANAKAIRLGPRTCGAFTWWSLIDQRVSMWTSLIGPTAVLILAVTGAPLAPLAYLAWVLLTRSTMALVDGAFWGRVYPSWPLLMFFNQVWGAWLRVYMLFRPDRQGWTRQRIGSSGSAHSAATSAALHAAALTAFVLFVAVGLGMVPSIPRHLIPAVQLMVKP